MGTITGLNPDERGRYAYFSSLERTIKIALAGYFVLLSGGLVLIFSGVEKAGNLLVKVPYYPLVLPAGLGLLFWAMYGIVSTTHRLAALHIWLDERFFGFLEKSNEIIFQAMVRVLESGEQSFARDLGTEERYSMIRSVFSRLADNLRLFDSLMESGIFRFWIWYWVMNYGVFTFTVLSIAGSAVMFAGEEPGLRTLFTICWISSLAHLAVNLVLGNHLTRLTRSVSESLVQDYKPQISRMLKEAFPNK